MFYKYAAPTALVLLMSVRQISAREFSKGAATGAKMTKRGNPNGIAQVDHGKTDLRHLARTSDLIV